MPYLSIIIPTKNEEKDLPTLLQTIRSQRYTDYELIVADNHSTDQTCEIARSFGARVVEGGLPGPGRNRGARVACGEVLLFLDADVQLPTAKFLEDCINEMRHKGVDMATCKIKGLSRKPIDRLLFEMYNTYALLTEKIRPHAPGSCMFVRRQVHEAIGGFDEEVVFAEDHDYVQRAQKMGFTFGLLRSQYIVTSVRRLEKDGRLAIAMKYLFGEIRMITKGSFKELPFEYRMGGEEAEKPDDAADRQNLGPQA